MLAYLAESRLRSTKSMKVSSSFVSKIRYYFRNSKLYRVNNVKHRAIPPQHRIVATFIKKIKDEKYDLLSYTAKKFDIKELFEVSFIKEKVDQKVFIISDSE